jgi:hypothetical protein
MDGSNTNPHGPPKWAADRPFKGVFNSHNIQSNYLFLLRTLEE